jgi:Peroxidase, family 2
MVHATLFSFLKGTVNPKSRERSQEIAKTQREDHAYARGNIDTRGPCPGLNSLANQGYLYVWLPSPGSFVAILTAVCTDPAMGRTLVYPKSKLR